MTLNYKLTSSDFLEYQLYASSKSIIQKKRRRNSRIIAPILFLLYGFYLTKKDENYIGISVFAVTATIWFICYPLYSKWRYKKHFEKHVKENYSNRINKPVEIIFNESSLNIKDFTSESKIHGTELKELIETKNHFFIKLTTDLSLIIPKRTVENQTEFKERLVRFGAAYVDEVNWQWE